MKIKNQLQLGRLVAKIDNDFNISESDWIPRVAAWVTDALSQMKVLPMQRKKRTIPVVNRIAQFPCALNATELTVYDEYGREISEANGTSKCGCINTLTKANAGAVHNIAVFDDDGEGKNYTNVATIGCSSNNHNYVLVCNDQIELNFDADNIIVESYEVATYYDDYYDCDCPYIYDNGLLLEALAWYVLFKYLSRGSKHPVYDLKSPNKAVNPFMQWSDIKAKAASSVKASLRDSSANEGWNNFFYNSTFLPRS